MQSGLRPARATDWRDSTCVPASVALSVEAHAQPGLHAPRQGRPQGQTAAQRNVGAGGHRGPQSIAEPRARVPPLRQDRSPGRHVAVAVRHRAAARRQFRRHDDHALPEQPVQRLATMALQRARLAGSRPGRLGASPTPTLRFVVSSLPYAESPPRFGLIRLLLYHHRE
jgi:hypothetical protein